MLLLVYLESASFLGSLEMDAKRRNAGDGLIDLDELLLHRVPPVLRLGTDKDATTNAKVSIEPRMPQPTTVALYSKLDAATGTALAPWLHLEVGTVK